MNAPHGLPEWITDKEVAAMLRVSHAHVWRMASLPEGSRLAKGQLDLREAEPIRLGRTRRWRRDVVLALVCGRPVDTETWRRNHLGGPVDDRAGLPGDGPASPARSGVN